MVKTNYATSIPVFVNAVVNCCWYTAAVAADVNVVAAAAAALAAVAIAIAFTAVPAPADVAVAVVFDVAVATAADVATTTVDMVVVVAAAAAVATLKARFAFLTFATYALFLPLFPFFLDWYCRQAFPPKRCSRQVLRGRRGLTGGVRDGDSLFRHRLVRVSLQQRHCHNRHHCVNSTNCHLSNGAGNCSNDTPSEELIF